MEKQHRSSESASCVSERPHGYVEQLPGVPELRGAGRTLLPRSLPAPLSHVPHSQLLYSSPPLSERGPKPQSWAPVREAKATPWNVPQIKQ